MCIKWHVWLAVVCCLYTLPVQILSVLCGINGPYLTHVPHSSFDASIEFKFHTFHKHRGFSFTMILLTLLRNFKLAKVPKCSALNRKNSSFESHPFLEFVDSEIHGV